jgi:hypothetical protein
VERPVQSGRMRPEQSSSSGRGRSGRFGSKPGTGAATRLQHRGLVVKSSQPVGQRSGGLNVTVSVINMNMTVPDDEL